MVKTVLELPKAQLHDLYRQMHLIRVFEERASEQYMRGKIWGFLHLYIGEEAIAVGAISALEEHDYVVTHYRDHGHAISKGLDPKILMAELFGKATGCSKGRGGSMHLFDASRNFMGGYAIVGGQLPIAVGLAQAIAYQNHDQVVLCFLGDGALSEGEFHEAMNLASVWNLPVVFLCENNLYGMGSPVAEMLAVKEIYRIAEPYNIPSCQVDGMKVLAVRETVMAAVDRSRNGGGPSFIEALTYRFRGHSVADPSDYRDKAEERLWLKRDPLILFRKHLLLDGQTSSEALDKIEKDTEKIVEEAILFADRSPEPDPNSLYEHVYAE